MSQTDNTSFIFNDYDGTFWGPLQPVLCVYPEFADGLKIVRQLESNFPYIDDLIFKLPVTDSSLKNDEKAVNIPHLYPLPDLKVYTLDSVRVLLPQLRHNAQAALNASINLVTIIREKVQDALKRTNRADRIHYILDTIGKHYSSAIMNQVNEDLIAIVFEEGVRLADEVTVILHDLAIKYHYFERRDLHQSQVNTKIKIIFLNFLSVLLLFNFFQSHAIHKSVCCI